MSFSSSSVFDKITLIENTRVETPNQSFTSSLLQDYKTSSLNNMKSQIVKNEYLSDVETALLRANEPINLTNAQEIEINGLRGVWANREESLKWKGPIPLDSYPINQDSNPIIINKKSNKTVEYIQELAIRYLKPPSVPPPGDIIINQLPEEISPPAPPIIIRQHPKRPITPEPIIIREAPPPRPDPVARKIITISGKRLPPPPRKVVIERLPPIPSKPQPVIIERWLPYPEVKRRVIFNKNLAPDPVIVKPRNVIVQWEAPQVNVRKQFKYLGVVRANPSDYIKRYGDSIVQPKNLPDFVRKIPAPKGVVLAADLYGNHSSLLHELYGDVEALKLVDLDREGLGQYKNYKAERTGKVVDFSTYNIEYLNKDSSVGSSISTRKEASRREHRLVDIIEKVFEQVSKDMSLMISYEDTMKVINLINERISRKFTEDDIRKILESLDLNNFIRTGTIRLSEFKKAILKYSLNF